MTEEQKSYLRTYNSACERYLNLFACKSEDENATFKSEFNMNIMNEIRKDFIYKMIEKDVNLLNYFIENKIDVAKFAKEIMKVESLKIEISSDPYVAASYITQYVNVLCKRYDCYYIKSVLPIICKFGNFNIGDYHESRENKTKDNFIEDGMVELKIENCIKNGDISFENLPDFDKSKCFIALREEVYEPFGNVFEKRNFKKKFKVNSLGEHIEKRMFIYYPKF